MAFVPGLIAGLGALGGLFGNRGNTQNQAGTQHSFTGNSASTLPSLSPESQAVLWPTADAFLANLNKDVDLKGYQANQQQDINQLADIKNKALQFQLSQRGINPNSPYALNAATNVGNQRFADTTRLNNSIPLLAQQIQQSKIGQGIDLFRTLPNGVVSQSTSENFGDSTGQMQNPGNMLGGLFGGLAPILAYLYGQGSFGGGGGGTQGPYKNSYPF